MELCVYFLRAGWWPLWVWSSPAVTFRVQLPLASLGAVRQSTSSEVTCSWNASVDRLLQNWSSCVSYSG